ncbi:MAG: serine/threonine protein kinase, partial [Proteobacteria bacterium]|nr:serine/threonine protein kinase [Pseudomonadota bacterium]
ILQVLSALHAAHQKGIIHRDLKPDNVFVAVDSRMREEIKLLDFGVAKVLQEGNLFPMNTQPGTVLGTPFYMSPEQARGGKDIDARSDIWSMGVVMYEMLAGRLPYKGDTCNEVIANVLMNDPVPLVKVAPWLNIDLCAIVAKAMAKDRGQRFQTVAEMVKSLTPLFGGFDRELRSVVAKAILDTVASPPLKGEITGPIEAGAETGKRSENPTHHMAKKRATGFPRRAVALIGVVALALLAVVAIVVFVAVSRSGGNDRPRAAAATPVALDLGAPAQTAAIVEPPSENVTIRIGGLPPDAMVLAAGKPVTTPFLLLRSDEAVAIQVTAAGYLPYATSLRPSQDLTLTAEMRKTPAGKSRAHRPPTEKWRSNPFE